jgi:hypothetical protein
MIPSGFSSISNLSPEEKVEARGAFGNFPWPLLYELVILCLGLHNKLVEVLAKELMQAIEAKKLVMGGADLKLIQVYVEVLLWRSLSRSFRSGALETVNAELEGGAHQVHGSLWYSLKLIGRMVRFLVGPSWSYPYRPP